MQLKNLIPIVVGVVWGTAAAALPDYVGEQSAAASQATAVFAGGCFWGVDAVFKHTKGVSNVVSGYAGGKAATANYYEVGSGTTGHAEAVEITYDPTKISYAELLKIFFQVAHDPTQLNRQGPDVGTQYRSAIFHHSPEQKAAAEAVIARLTKEKIFGRPIVTEVAAATAFYPAEAYHQRYFERVGGANPYCTYVIEPKVAKFRKHYADRLKRAAKEAQ